MFGQLSWTVTDALALQALGERLVAELKPRGHGLAGVDRERTAYGIFVVFARFESAQAARSSTDRPEHRGMVGRGRAVLQRIAELSVATMTALIVVGGGGAAAPWLSR